IRPAFHYSHVLNYLFSYTPIGVVEQPNYRDFLDQCFMRQEIWGTHIGELSEISGFAKEKKMPFAVVIFPLMQDVQGTMPMTRKIASHFEDQEIPVIDLGPLLVDWKMEDCLVDAVDPHPSEQVNRLVGDTLAGLLNRLGW
ncbi:MAG: hypothetical protein AAF570_26840, partial [Bacteroidota bacterium]